MRVQEKEELYILMNALREEVISDEQFVRLDQLISNDSGARHEYLRFIKLWRDLRLYEIVSHQEDLFQATSTNAEPCFDAELWTAIAEAEKNSPALSIQEKPQRPVIDYVVYEKSPRMLNKRSLAVAICSAAALLFLIILIRFAPSEGGGVGKLMRTIDAKWESVNGPIQEGQYLHVGPMVLSGGLAEIQMEDRTRLIIQSPAEFHLESPSQIYLQSGRLVALVTKGEATFVVRTPHASIVDYGTEFGVEVDSRNGTEAYVFQGAVELRDSSNPLKFTQSLQLAPHQGAISNLHGTIQSHPINFHKYVHLREFDARLQAGKGSAYHRWLAYKFAVQRDPSLVAHYTFEKDPVRPHLLINAVSPDQMTGVFGEADSPGPAPIWAIGRWPQKESLDFNWISNDIVSGPDHLPGEVNQEITTVIPSLVNVPTNPELNIAEAITLAVWIKCPSFEKGGGGPILTNRSKSKVNYQIHFGLGGEGGRRTLIRSMGFARYDASLGEVPKIESREVFFDPDKWHHVVITHDNQMVVYYLDGQLYDRQPYVYKSSAVAEDLIIGGWHGREFGLSGRPFSGKIDEIMIFNRVLSENEVKAMYEQSKP